MATQKQIENNDFPTSGSDESTKPTIVLVHGAVEDSSLWTHGVIQRLQRDGYPFKVFSNPLRGGRTTLHTCVACWTRSRGP